ncbi:hypothetical protein FACS1894125_5800 [Actinomycetota bacterium]|nr:hypothetical protein FACS1894125_5800 [Actinomycetota bacterium]
MNSSSNTSIFSTIVLLVKAFTQDFLAKIFAIVGVILLLLFFVFGSLPVGTAHDKGDFVYSAADYNCGSVLNKKQYSKEGRYGKVDENIDAICKARINEKSPVVYTLLAGAVISFIVVAFRNREKNE